MGNDRVRLVWPADGGTFVVRRRELLFDGESRSMGMSREAKKTYSERFELEFLSFGLPFGYKIRRIDMRKYMNVYALHRYRSSYLDR